MNWGRYNSIHKGWESQSHEMRRTGSEGARKPQKDHSEPWAL